MTKVKICGITNLEDALSATKFGADALGFIFYRKSPRYINPVKAKQILQKLPRRILRIGVFVNTRKSTIRRIAKDLKLDVLQFHGKESAEFCSCFKDYKVIKAFRIKDKIKPKSIFKYKDVWAYLFDSFTPCQFGGTGKTFNWQALKGFFRVTGKCLFLSGGLNPDNIKRAIEIVHPQWIDASSSLEIYPGKKDPIKLKQFMRKIKG
ncbi:MAG: phosphoribosylanthranilate isomerase [Candidatus Omnitrophica bacterium]|nr:phosphoribosylanthranilate isomerase [Candidatus Omnitrophota bacterium]